MANHEDSQDFNHCDTQPFDSSSQHSSEADDDDDKENRYFEDTVPFDDELEIQAVDLADDTEVLDIADDTEVLDIGDETQKLDDFDTQLLDEGYESDGTEILEDVDDDGVDDLQRWESGQSADCEEVVGRLINERGDDEKQTSSGSVPPRFTFLRAESMREAALAKRNMDLKHTEEQSNSVTDMNQFCQEPLAVKNRESVLGCSEKVREIDQEFNHGKNNVEIERSENESMPNFARTTVRRLSYDDLPVETNAPPLSNNDFNEGDCLDKFPDYHGELERLSYVNSQEPGELSQINALDCVDRFLQCNLMEVTEETIYVKNMENKSESLPCIKGELSLSKKINDRSKAKQTRIYDWDDDCEDEGGGDIYQRRKRDFFDGGTQRPRSLPGCRKIKSRRPKGDKEDEEQPSIPMKKKTAAHSESRLGMHNLKIRDDNIKEGRRKLARNIANELDEQSNANCSRGEMGPNGNEDGQEMLDVGIDTQIAAEAMEALFNTVEVVDHVANDTTRVTRSRSAYQLNNSSTGKTGPVKPKDHAGKYDKKRKFDVKSDLQASGLSKKCTKRVGQCENGNVMNKSKKSKLNAEGNQTSGARRIVSSPIGDRTKSAEALKRHQLDELNNLKSNDGRSTVNEEQFQGNVFHCTPIARRTRRSLAVNESIKSDISCKRLREGAMGTDPHEKSSGVGLQASKGLGPKSTSGSSDHFAVDNTTEVCQQEKLASKENVVSVSSGVTVDTLNYPRRRRSLRIMKISNHDEGSENLVGSSKSLKQTEDTGKGSSKSFEQTEDIGKSTTGKRKMRTRSVVKSHANNHSPSSSSGGLVVPSDDQMQKKPSKSNLNSNIKNSTDVLLSTKNLEVTIPDESPRDGYKSPDMATTSPANFKTPVKNASPVCMGDDYFKQSCNKNLSRSCLLKVYRKDLHRELCSLSTIRPELITPSKDSRKRKDMTDVRVLYSRHLDEDIIKHQKKILARLGVSVASSIADATHFITDQFVRTRNMLEAIAFGKPVVTHLWIESCGQANCFIDERNYILRDAKKEKEFGFSMPVSLARASQHPLLEGRRVLITPSTKPSKEIISSLVMAVHGQAVERVSRSAMKDHKIPDDLLILSCEEDYSSCVPFLEKGAVVYSSELLLNGIVTQKLEYERHRLFVDNVKKTRSTIWLKRDDKFTPVTKCN
ncbi:hypothetical protein L195_g000118 [Trifolium pratense]|uniref:BRCT domain-containing protein n=2 Tax=Trifolium pratense TaxID=57577 RepID=A0A2K3NL10_TRIPR|nr:hypothetical protein L195_g000118 [Trifolium pratense]CAJ2658564.1 unnamed protein product [Trifolium pratense]